MKDELCRRCRNMSYGKENAPDYGRMRCALPPGGHGVVDGECIAFVSRTIRSESPCYGCADREYPFCYGICEKWSAYRAEGERRKYERVAGIQAQLFLKEGMVKRVKARGLR